jgi:hypothetical protein
MRGSPLQPSVQGSIVARLCQAVLAVLLLQPALQAWNPRGIAGKIVDAKGTPVPAATIRVISNATGASLQTISAMDGTFAFRNLPAGTYRLEVEMRGFEKLTLADINPELESSGSLALTLKHARSGQAPAPAAANTPQRPAQAGPAPAKGRPGGPPAFREVDLTGVSEADVTQSAPSAVAGPAAGQEVRSLSGPDGSDLLVITGNASASIDAGDWSNPEFRNRIREMADRMGFGGIEGMGPPGAGMGTGEAGGPPGFGQFGGGPGGRAGFGGGGFRGTGGFGGGRGRGPMGGGGMGVSQPRLNGSVFVTYSNSALNAQDYSLTGQEVPKPLSIQNNFGATVGGPLPWGGSAGSGMGARQPGMWFFSYQGARNHNSFNSLATVPTELERSGDFSQTVQRQGSLAGLPVVIHDPLTPSDPVFPDATIPAGRLNPSAVGLFQYIPLPNLPGAVQNFTMQRSLIGDSDGFSARVNSRVSPKDNVFANYSLVQGNSTSSQIFPGLDTDRTSRSQNVSVGGMHRFKPRLIANYRFSFNRVRTLSSNPFAFHNDVEGNLGITGVSTEPVNWGVPTVSFTNYGGLQLGNTSLIRNQTFTLGGGLRRIGSRHSLMAGGAIAWSQLNSLGDPNARGTFTFTGFTTSAFDASGHPIAGTGWDLADFLLGLPYSTSRRYGSSDNYLRSKSLNLFIQDNWRIRSNLTVNFGVRYEYSQPYSEKYDHMVNLDVAPDFTAVAQVLPCEAGPYTGPFPCSLVFSDYNNLGPRLGIAWKPKSNANWVVRAGYGFFYNPSVYPYIAGQLVGQPPFATGQNVLTTPSSPLTLQDGFPADPDVTIRNSYAIDPHYRTGYIQQWNLNLQTLVRRIYTIEVGYIGSKGTRLDILRAPNRAPFGVPPGQTENNLQISDAGSFLYQESGANSILHGMRVRVSRRFSEGLSVQGSYTFSKSIDDASRIGGGSTIVVQNDQDIDAERSLSSFDQRQVFRAMFIVDLPFGQHRKYFGGAGPLVQQLVGGWSFNGDYQLASGMPVTARLLGNVSNNSGTGSNDSERPDSVGIPVALPGDTRSTTDWFNILAFAVPPPGQFGDAGRNTITGPGSNILNLALRKTFRLDEHNRRLEFRCAMTNVLNHPNYAGVATVINSLDFGRITSVRPMRQVTFFLRLNF